MKTRLLIVATICAILVSASVNAQWYQQVSGTVGNLNSVHCINDSTCYSVGFQANVRKTIDGGSTMWTVPGLTPGTENKLCVKMLNKDTILIGLYNGSFKMTTTGSTTNTWLPNPYSGSNTSGIYDIFYHSATKFTAVGGSISNSSSGGNIITTSTNTGVNWTAITNSGQPTMFGIHAINSSTFVACAGAGTIYKSTNAGVSWTVKKSGVATTSLYDINFPTPSIGYVVGGSSTTLTATGSVVYKTTDGGETWTTPSNTGLLPNTLYGVHFVNKDTGYVVGDGGKIQVTKDGGATWSTQISPVTTTLNKIFFPSKNVGYIAGNNGVILKTIDGGFIPPLIVNAGQNASICPGFCATIGSASIATGGTPPYTYSWSPVVNTNSSLVVCPTVNTTYTVTVTDVNSVTSTGTVSVSIYTVGAVSFSGLPPKYCLNGSDISLAGNPTGGIFSGSGVTGTSLNPIVAGSGTHTVSYTFTDTHGCIKTSATQSITITSIPAKASLCMVTVDSLNSTTNIIVWEKPISNSIANFRIYRKSPSGVMTYIKSVDYTAPAKFIDNTNGVDPKTNAYTYKVSIVDTCGVESAKSDSNITILLQTPIFDNLLNQFTLYWSDYEGFAFANYEIWRMDSLGAKWKKLDAVPYIGPNQYIDTTPIPPYHARYRIQASYPAGCMIDAGTTLHSTMSNVTSDTTIGVIEISLNNLLNVYPNPNRGTFMFQLSGIQYQTLNIQIYSMLGKLIYESKLKNQKSEITIPEISPGIYQLRVITDKGIANKKITIQ